MALPTYRCVGHAVKQLHHHVVEIVRVGHREERLIVLVVADEEANERDVDLGEKASLLRRAQRGAKVLEEKGRDADNPVVVDDRLVDLDDVSNALRSHDSSRAAHLSHRHHKLTLHEKIDARLRQHERRHFVELYPRAEHFLSDCRRKAGGRVDEKRVIIGIGDKLCSDVRV